VRILVGLVLVIGALWLGNTSRFVDVPEDRRPGVIAHRGAHQIYAGEDLSADTCRAAQIEPPTHPYIENTLPSILAAFEAGAVAVEIDVHLTTDGHLVVFHDWGLDCQTNGRGVTRDFDLASLQALDIGFGFTSDGETFPFRDQEIGPMPTLDDILSANLPGPVLVNFKSRDALEAQVLAKDIEKPTARARLFGVYGGRPPTQAALETIPGLRGFDRASAKACLLRYAFLGWSGHIPKACRNTLVPVPLNVGPWLWGWPHRLTDRMQGAGSDVIVLGPWDGSGFTSGIDDAETLARVPKQLGGYVWTNRILDIGPAVAAR
jgi:glycerophosphoryl diester phosphodiesterase